VLACRPGPGGGGGGVRAGCGADSGKYGRSWWRGGVVVGDAEIWDQVRRALGWEEGVVFVVRGSCVYKLPASVMLMRGDVGWEQRGCSMA
jgi:hypothetical protein